jgi:hypothetical protein
MREKVEDPGGGMRMHAGADVGDVVDGVGAVLLAAGYERVEDGELVSGVLVADEEDVFASNAELGIDARITTDRSRAGGPRSQRSSIL